MSKTLVLFVYHIYNKRVHHFIRKCIFYDENIDFVIISNNEIPPPSVPPYVRLLVRKNIGYDFGGWSDALLSNNLYENYDNFIFVNSSVIGPFIRGGTVNKWTDIYLSGLTGNVKLFGSTINCCDNPLTKAHVQSYIFSMKKETLKYLIDCQIFSIKNYAKTFNNAIWDKEVLMSRKIIQNGWNIGSLMTQYRGVDFTFRTRPMSSYNTNWYDDIMQPQYVNDLWNEYQLVFIKGNRININSTEEMSKFHTDTSTIVSRNMNMIKVTNNVTKIKMSKLSSNFNVGLAKPMKLIVPKR